MNPRIDTSDEFILINRMFSTQLPPLLGNLINEWSSVKLIEHIKSENIRENIYYKGNGRLYTQLTSSSRAPKHFYNVKSGGTESINFYTIKSDGTFRPLSVPNIKYAILFSYNLLEVKQSLIHFFYDDKERRDGISSHSELPIVGYDNHMFDLFQYPQKKINSFVDTTQPDARFFVENEIRKVKLESTYPYILKIDLSKFYENVYTHLFGDLSFKKIDRIINPTDFYDYVWRLSLPNSEVEKLKAFFNWLDTLNQKINNNHTKGILQGPISSRISAEILQLYIDEKIIELLRTKPSSITFTRYVDDYKFYAKNQSDLENLKIDLTHLFREFSLPLNDSKIEIYKGFEKNKGAHLNADNMKWLRKKDVKIGIRRFLEIRNTFSSLIDKSDWSSVKSLLTHLTKNDLYFDERNHNIPIVFIEMLVKLVYINGSLTLHAYKLLAHVVTSKLPRQTRKNILEKLMSESEYISKLYSDSDLEIWHYYVMSLLSDAQTHKKIFQKYRSFKGSKESHPIILTVLIKERSLATNKLILDELIQFINIDEPGIAQSKWWLPISKLWIVYKKSKYPIPAKIDSLFNTKKNNPAYDKLGIIKLLFDYNK